MTSVGSTAARIGFSALLDRAANGERITITKRGVPVAILVPTAESSHLRRKQVIEELKKFGQARRGTGFNVRESIREGRRF